MARRRTRGDAGAVRAAPGGRPAAGGRRGHGERLRAAFAGDVAYNRAAGLPGGPAEIALFHYAVDGLLLDRLTLSIDPDTPTDAVVDALVDGLLPPAQGAGATSSTR